MITLEAAKQVADDSPDHICPVGAIRDNFTSQGLIAEVKDGFDDEQISMLDLGCAGGQFVVDFIKEGEYVTITNVGAYGSTLSSNYNTRPLASEIIVKKGKIKIIRKRQKISEII